MSTWEASGEDRLKQAEEMYLQLTPENRQKVDAAINELAKKQEAANDQQ